MRIAARLLILAALLLLPACRRGSPAAAPAPPRWTATPPQRVYYDNAGGIQDSLRLVIRDAQELQSVWSRATSKQTAPPPVPEVDFEREMLLVVAAGRRGAEDRIRVDSVGVLERSSRGRGGLAAVVRLTEGCGRFNTDAYPVEIVRVQRSDAPVEWIERREQSADCPRSSADLHPTAGPGRPGPARGDAVLRGER